jgi:hypothetical protein
MGLQGPNTSSGTPAAVNLASLNPYVAALVAVAGADLEAAIHARFLLKTKKVSYVRVIL